MNIILHGASDDLIEIDGDIEEEFGARSSSSSKGGEDVKFVRSLRAVEGSSHRR